MPDLNPTSPAGKPEEPVRNEEGPRGTYGCACVARDSVECAAIRILPRHHFRNRKHRRMRCAVLRIR